MARAGSASDEGSDLLLLAVFALGGWWLYSQQQPAAAADRASEPAVWPRPSLTDQPPVAQIDSDGRVVGYYIIHGDGTVTTYDLQGRVA